ncbi:MAG TPA: YciI family protein [Candidatus Binatia bacterium]
MKYMLLIYGDERELDDEYREGCYRESSELAHELAKKGAYVGASPLHPTSTATSVRVRDGRRMVTDGPFAETREQLGGFYMVDVPNLDEAIAIAARIPMAKKGTIEIRPVMELPSLPPWQVGTGEEGR